MQINERKMRVGGDNDGGLGERLIQQILDGAKTVTCDLKSLCTRQELADLSAPPGWLETVVDSRGAPRCNVRVTAVYETPFGDPDPRLVRGEGDGEDVERFKREHGRWFSAVLKERGLPPLTEGSALLVWEFELVERPSSPQDLLSRDCPIRFIITVNALKEGWDCPFAYVLASLANKSSVVDVEQILGRVLRQPYVREHQEPLLNMSYVLTASNDFLGTLNKITVGLNHAGFSRHDYREIDGNSLPGGARVQQNGQVQQGLFALTEAINNAAATVGTGDEAGEDIDVDRIALPDTRNETANTAAQVIEAIAEQAVRLSEAYEQSIQQSDTGLPQELEDMLNKQPMKEIYLSAAQQIRLPQFFIKVQGRGGFFDEGENHILLESNHLLGSFRLNQCNIDIPFSETDTDMYAVDLEESARKITSPLSENLIPNSAHGLTTSFLPNRKRRSMLLLTNAFATL